MATWSGTSFSTPVVAGLIAARQSGRGTARQAADALIQLAQAQPLPGTTYAVLRPGQACLHLSAY
jgi:subtilase family serine protease